MSLWAKVRQVVQTAVSDLFSEETETAVPDRTAAQLDDFQRRLHDLKNELALALAREKQAETVWRTAEAQGQPFAADLAEQHHSFVESVAVLQREIERLQTEVTAVAKQSAHLVARAENVAMRERLQKVQRELDKTTRTLHHELAERQEQIAQREDVVAAREEMRTSRKDSEL